MPNLLITGANRGIGLEFVKQYAEAGWQVFACCRNPEESDALKHLASQHMGMLSLYALDIADFDQIDNLAKKLSGIPIDVMINNAGIYPDARSGDFGATDYKVWEHAFRVNCMASMKMAEAFASQIAASQQKKIINITSKMGSVDDNTSGGHYLYRSSKAALNMVTKSLAIDLAPLGVVAAVAHPGWVKTDMGGPNAWITTEQSVNGMRRVIEQLTRANSGKFYAYDGKEVPW